MSQILQKLSKIPENWQKFLFDDESETMVRNRYLGAL